MTNPKTKRDRAAGRHHRHTAIQTIIDNHNQVRTDIASIDHSISALQDETCDLGSKLVAWTAHLEEQTKHARIDIGCMTMRLVENERKAAETESAVAFLQHTSKEHQEAIAQLVAYTNKVHGKQTNLNHNITITRIDLKAMEKKFITLAWINLGIWVAAALTLFILLLIVS